MTSADATTTQETDQSFGGKTYKTAAEITKGKEKLQPNAPAVTVTGYLLMLTRLDARAVYSEEMLQLDAWVETRQEQMGLLVV